VAHCVADFGSNEEPNFHNDVQQRNQCMCQLLLLGLSVSDLTLLGRVSQWNGVRGFGFSVFEFFIGKKVLTRFTFEIPMEPFSLAVIASSSFVKVSIQVFESLAQRSFHVKGCFPLLSSQSLSACHGWFRHSEPLVAPSKLICDVLAWCNCHN